MWVPDCKGTNKNEMENNRHDAVVDLCSRVECLCGGK